MKTWKISLLGILLAVTILSVAYSGDVYRQITKLSQLRGDTVNMEYDGSIQWITGGADTSIYADSIGFHIREGEEIYDLAWVGILVQDTWDLIDDKITKIADGVDGNFPVMYTLGGEEKARLYTSIYGPTSFLSTDEGALKANKILLPTLYNFIWQAADGDIGDSGYSAASFALAAHIQGAQYGGTGQTSGTPEYVLKWNTSTTMTSEPASSVFSAVEQVVKTKATGLINYTQLPVGAVASTVAAGDDSRFTDARTPTAHGSSHILGGNDQIAGWQYFRGYENDFVSTAGITPWVSGSVASGSINIDVPLANHPGVVNFKSSASVNSGTSVKTNANSFLLGGTESSELVFYTSAVTNVTTYFGFHNSINQTAPTKGAWINIAGTTLDGRTINVSGNATTGTSYTISPSTWYRLKIVVDSNATRVDFYLYLCSTGALLWTDYLTTYIPVAAGDETAHGVVSTYSTGGAQSILLIDYMNVGKTKELAR